MARVKCPGLFCGSKDVVPLTTKKMYKTGKGLVNAAIGGAIAGPVGALVGAGTGLNGKKVVTFQCLKCGKIFTAKV